METIDILDSLASGPVETKIPTILPIVYKTGTNFDILPHLDLSRKEAVWGFQILPGIFLAKKCGIDGNVENTTWANCKAFAESMFLNGKRGCLPLRKVFKKDLRDKIQQMDKLFCENGIDGETRSADDISYVGHVWCCEANDDKNDAFSLCLENNSLFWGHKSFAGQYDRVAVAF